MTVERLSYPEVGVTAVAASEVTAPSHGRWYERSVQIGSGPEFWARVGEAVLQWEVKTRSGFSVHPETAAARRVTAGSRYRLVAHVAVLRVMEPVQVVDVVESATRVGFSYGTLPGHPVRGEEAFVIALHADGSVWLTLRSFTRPAPGPWWPVFPALLVAQRFYRRRYLRALQAT